MAYNTADDDVRSGITKDDRSGKEWDLVAIALAHWCRVAPGVPRV